MALLDDEELLPFFGNPNIQRQGARARALAAQRDVNTLPDPRTYAAVSGLLGTAPDQMGFSVLNPDYQGIQRTAKPAFTLGTLLGFAPLTKGLPVGASIKPINLSKGIFNPEITMQEMLRVRDIPTVERVQRSMDLVGEKKFQEMVESQFKQYKPTNQTQEAMLVESVTLDILGRANRDPKLLRGLPGLKIPAPQQAALDLAQQRAALPVEQGGLGLRAGNTAEQRAKAMGFDMETYHGTNAPDIRSIDVNKSRSDVQYMPGFFTADNPNLAQNYGDIVMPLLQKKGTTILDRRAARQSGQEVPMLDTVYDKEKGILVTNNPENIRSRFAAFDPFRRSAAVAATMGAAAPDLLAAQQDEEMRKLQQLGLLGMVAP
jgi:hypothetical protein